MVDGIGFKDEMKNERKKWSQMNNKQRWDYFKSYYMVQTIIVIALVISAISIIHTQILNHREVVLSGTFINVAADQTLYDALEDGYFQYVEGNSKKQQIELTTEQVMDFSEDGYDNTTYYKEMAVIAEITAKELDYMFVDKTAFERWESYAAYADLSEILSAEQLEKYKDNLIYVTDEDTGETYPAAIQLEGTDLAEKFNIQCVYADDSAYLAIIVNGPNADEAADFIAYLEAQ